MGLFFQSQCVASILGLEAADPALAISQPGGRAMEGQVIVFMVKTLRGYLLNPPQKLSHLVLGFGYEVSPKISCVNAGKVRSEMIRL